MKIQFRCYPITLIIILILIVGIISSCSNDMITEDSASDDIELTDLVFGLNDAYYGLFENEETKFSLTFYLRETKTSANISDDVMAKNIFLNNFLYSLIDQDDQVQLISACDITIKRHLPQGTLYSISFALQPELGQWQYQKIVMTNRATDHAVQYDIGSIIFDVKGQEESIADKISITAGSGLTNASLDYIFFGFANNAENTVEHLGLEFIFNNQDLQISKILTFADQLDVVDDALAIEEDTLLQPHTTKYYKYIFDDNELGNRFITIAPFCVFEINGEKKYLNASIPAQFEPLTYLDPLEDEQIFIDLMSSSD